MKATWHRRFMTAVLFPIFCAMVISGCGGVDKILSIIVTPASVTLAPGAKQQFTAKAMLKDGSVVDVTAVVVWSSGTTSVATISVGGLATAVATGSSVITASEKGHSGTANLTVSPPVTLVSIAITAPSPQLGVNGTVQLTATGTFSDNSTADITSQITTWSSDATGVATVSNTGLVTGVSLGTANITASLNGVTSPKFQISVLAKALTSVVVTPANPTVPVGGTADFVATANFSDNTSQVLTSGVTWAAGAGAAILQNGVATGQAVGSSTITATFTGVSGMTTLNVAAAVARAAYASGTGDSDTATYILKAASGNLYPIGTGFVPNVPIQAVPEPSGRFAFLLSANVIITSGVDPVTGRLTGQASSFTTNVNSNFGVVDPTGQYLFVASSNGAGTTLDSYVINLTDGSLTRVGGAASGLPLGANLISVITDRAGQFLYAVDNGAVAGVPMQGKVFAFSIGAGGALTALATPSYPTGVSAQYPAVDPTNTYLYIPNQSDNSITGYKINVDGSLTAVTGSPFTTGIGLHPFYALADATSKFLFVTNSDDNTISSVSINSSTGALGAAAAGSPFPTGVTPSGIAIDPTNQALLVANLFGNSVSVYSLAAATGVLTPAALPQVESPSGPFFISLGIGTATANVNPGAVYAVNPGTGDISAFTSTAATGALTPAGGSPLAGSAGNSFAAADLAGNLLFTGGAGKTQVSGASITQSTAALTALSGSPFTIAGPDFGSAVYVSPTDTAAYTMDVTAGQLVQNLIDPVAGSVTSPGTPFAAFAGATNIAADPQGDFVYALGKNGTSGILPFTTYAASGAITASTQPNLPGNWTSGSVDGSGQFFVAVDSTAKLVQVFTITPAGTSGGAGGVDGTLTAVAVSGSINLSGTGPWLVAFDPQDRAIFVADQLAGTVTPYPFTYSSGAVGAAGTVTTVSAQGVSQIATDITGTYLYAGVNASGAPGSKGAIAVYKIGAAGALTAVAGTPATGGGNPGIAVTNVVQ